MGTLIQLCTSEYCIQIDAIEEDWCSCRLFKGEAVIYLGANTLKYLKDHLLSGLDDGAKETRAELLGHKVSWVLTLAEAHHILYVANDGMEKVLLWQDRYGEIVAIIRLSHDQCLQWRSQLESLED